MQVESGTAPLLTATPGEAMAPVGLPGRSSIHTNGALGELMQPLPTSVALEAIASGPGDPKHLRMMPSQLGSEEDIYLQPSITESSRCPAGTCFMVSA